MYRGHNFFMTYDYIDFSINMPLDTANHFDQFTIGSSLYTIYTERKHTSDMKFEHSVNGFLIF